MVGDPGVGKTAVAEGLAVKIVKKEVPKYLQDHTVFNLDVGTMLAGTQYRGQFEERVKEVLEALISKQKCILFIDEAHTLKGAGGGSSGGTDFANMLKPYLGRGKLKVIASTTWEEYSSSFEKDRALMRRFYHITVTEPSPALAKEILTNSAKYYEEFHGCKFTHEAINNAVDLSVRYLTDKRLPDKAFDMIDSAAAKQRRLGTKKPIIDKQNILEEINEYMSQVPKSVGVLLDLAHMKISSNIYGFNKDRFLENFMIDYADRLYEVHISDNDGIKDQHLGIKEGSWVINAIKHIKQDKSLIDLERNFCLECHNASTDEITKSLNLINQTIA